LTLQKQFGPCCKCANKSKTRVFAKWVIIFAFALSAHGKDALIAKNAQNIQAKFTTMIHSTSTSLRVASITYTMESSSQLDPCISMI
jgi:gamma-glutamylcysteine synthetase